MCDKMLHTYRFSRIFHLLQYCIVMKVQSIIINRLSLLSYEKWGLSHTHAIPQGDNLIYVQGQI